MFSFEVPVQDGNGEEEGLVVALEVGEHLNHPVDHAGAQRWSDLVLDQAVRGVELVLQLPLVNINVFSVLVLNMESFAFNFAELGVVPVWDGHLDLGDLVDVVLDAMVLRELRGRKDLVIRAVAQDSIVFFITRIHVTHQLLLRLIHHS